MPETPPSDDLNAADDAAELSPAANVSDRPRTVKQRIPRLVQASPAVPSVPVAPAPSSPVAPAADEPEVSVSEPEVEVEIEESQVESLGEAQAELAEQSAHVESAASAAESQSVATSPFTTQQAPAAAAQQPAHAPAEPVAQTRAAVSNDVPRTGRIEVPVPSVVRARERAEIAAQNPVVLSAESLTKSYGQLLAAADVSFDVHAGSLTGVVGPNGAGKTTVLSMVSGLNRPSSGRITVRDIDVWGDGPAAKRVIGSLPDRLRLFDRLTGGQLLYYAGVLQGLDQATVAQRAAELAEAFGLETALDRPVSDYSAGMQKKIGLACSMIHAPEVLVLDEPYETIDPVSASNVTEILEKFVAGGGSVIMSSHSLDLIQRICDHVVVIVDGSIVAQGTVDEVRDGVSLEERFKHLTQTTDEGKGLEWLHGSSDSD